MRWNSSSQRFVNYNLRVDFARRFTAYIQSQHSAQLFVSYTFSDLPHISNTIVSAWNAEYMYNITGSRVGRLIFFSWKSATEAIIILFMSVWCHYCEQEHEYSGAMTNPFHEIRISIPAPGDLLSLWWRKYAIIINLWRVSFYLRLDLLSNGTKLEGPMVQHNTIMINLKYI